MRGIIDKCQRCGVWIDNLGYKTKQKIYCSTCLFQRKKEINNLSKQKKRKLHKL